LLTAIRARSHVVPGPPDVRSAPKGGMPRVAAECAIVWPIRFGDIVTAGSSDHCSDKIEMLPHALFDHIVRQEQKGFAYRQAETFGRFKIDDELELIR
jgi:hypothetical protein